MRRDASQIPGFRVFLQPIQNINFGARQTRTQFLYTLQGLNLDELYEWSQRLEQRLLRLPQLQDVNTDLQLDSPVVQVNVNRDRATALGVSIDQVRQALFNLQQSFRRSPGLVADGRDMGSVIFTDAALKIFLTATVEIRADRRYKQPIASKYPTTYDKVLLDLQARDYRDSQRRASPLIQTPDALLLDTTQLSIQQAVNFVLNAFKKVA